MNTSRENPILILASTSPRRIELMKELKIPFEAHPPAFDEASSPRLSPEAEAILFARQKALSLKGKFPRAVIIGSDTIVELDGKKMGKPRDVAEAKEMLRTLSGKTHRVLTGLAVLQAETGKLVDSLSIAPVKMKSISEQAIADYVATGEPMDKAGAYAVQGLGGALVERVEGDVLTVVGFPLQALRGLLGQIGVHTSLP